MWLEQLAGAIILVIDNVEMLFGGFGLGLLANAICRMCGELGEEVSVGSLIVNGTVDCEADAID